MFKKPLAELTPEDILAVCERGITEDGSVEFKRELSFENGQVEPWSAGGNKIGKEAKKDLIKEVIAFANAYGGTLLLGVEEGEGMPSRAEQVRPVPRCHELVDRLAAVFRDSVEPKIPMLSLGAVETADDGSGVVVVQVAPSRLAPHRSLADRECYIRRRDRSEKMTMREIQDLTIQRLQGGRDVEAVFQRSKAAFSDFRAGAVVGEPQVYTAFRCSAAPLDQIHIHRVHNVPDAKPVVSGFTARFNTQDQGFDVSTFLRPGGWRPILRGTKAIDEPSGGSGGYCSVTDVGEIDIAYLVASDDRRLVYPSTLVGTFAATLASIERFRSQAGAFSCEYVLQAELEVFGVPHKLGGYGFRPVVRTSEQFDTGAHEFPLYSVGSQEEFQELAGLFEGDLQNLAGFNRPNPIMVDF